LRVRADTAGFAGDLPEGAGDAAEVRIIYLSASAIPSRGADSIHVVRMCEAFGKNGHETTLVGKQCGNGPIDDIYGYYGAQRNFELDLIHCRPFKGVGILTLPKLYVRLRRYDPKEVLIYARDIYGISLAVQMGFRVIYESHAAPYNSLVRHLETTLLKNPHLIQLVVISGALKAMYMSRFAIGRKNVVCHDAATVPGPGDPGDLPWPPCRRTLQIGYTGHLYPGRGIEIIVDCAKCLPQYDFHVVGGTEADIAFWKGQAPGNLYFHGFLQPAITHHARARCDVLLMPYQKVLRNGHTAIDTAPWMSPMKMFEYMASRKAIIASDLPVLREVLDERKAVLLPPDDTERWVEAIRRCEDRRFRDSLAQNAYEAFLADYTWEKRAATVLSGVEV